MNSRGYRILAIIYFVTLFGFVYSAASSSTHWRIDTGLAELNPEFSRGSGLKLAQDAIYKSLAARAIFVVEGVDNDSVVAAETRLSEMLEQIEALHVVNTDSIAEDYVAAVEPYRFNMLSKNQAAQIKTASVDELVDLFIGSFYSVTGIRLLSFENDPLGTLSTYVLTQLEKIAEGGDDLERGERILLVEIADVQNSMDSQQRLFDEIIQAVSFVQEHYAVHVYYSGSFFFMVDSAQAAKRDIQRIVIGSIIVIVTLMLFLFRSVAPLVLSLASVLIGVATGMVVSLLVFHSIHVLTIVFGATLIGIAVDYSIHYSYYQRGAVKDEVKASLISERRAFLRALSLSLVTSLFGYGTLVLSGLPLLQKVAVFSVSGLLFSWMTVLVLGPFIVMKSAAARGLADRVLGMLSGVVLLNKCFKRGPVGLLLAAIFVFFALSSNIKYNDDPRTFFHPSQSLIAMENKVDGVFEMFEAGRFVLIEASNQSDLHRNIESLYEQLGPLQGQVVSLIDWVPTESRQREHYLLNEKLYGADGVLVAVYRALGVDPKNSVAFSDRYYSSNNQILRPDDLLKRVPAIPLEVFKANNRVYSFVLIKKQSDFGEIEAASLRTPGSYYVDVLKTATESIKDQRESAAMLLAGAYLLITVVLILLYRSFDAFKLIFVPVTSSLITLALLIGFGEGITIFHLVSLFLVLGLGLDYVIFAREMRLSRGTTSSAITLSAVTSLMSFGLLAFSSMPIAQDFGLTVLLANSLNYILTLFVLVFQGQRESDVK